MLKLSKGIRELYVKVATSLPPDVEEAMKEARASEESGSEASRELKIHLETVTSSRKEHRPICVDSGVPYFNVSVPEGLSHNDVRNTIIAATREATTMVPLSPNAVDPLRGENTGDNTGVGFPVINIEQTDRSSLTVELMFLSACLENLGRTYVLPDGSIGAGRDLDGVAKCVMDAIRRTEGQGCPPYIVGVGIGTTRDQVTRLAKDQFRRRLKDENPQAELAAFEGRMLREINAAAAGIKGLNRRTAALGVKVGAAHRHPDSFFVDVSLICWNTRRGKLIW